MKTCIYFSVIIFALLTPAYSASTIVLAKSKSNQSITSIGTVTTPQKTPLKLGTLRKGDAVLPSKKLTLSERSRLRLEQALARKKAITAATTPDQTPPLETSTSTRRQQLIDSQRDLGPTSPPTYDFNTPARPRRIE